MRISRLLITVALLTPLTKAAAQTTLNTAAVNPANFDTTCAPCQDFYKFVNGGWLLRTPIPTLKQSEMGTGTFGEARNEGSLFVSQAVRKAAEQSAKSGDIKKPIQGDTSVASNAQLVGALYNRCRDEKSIQSNGINPLKPWLKRIDASKTSGDIVKTSAAMDLDGINTMLHFTANRGVTALSMLGNIETDGLGLDDPELYTGTDTSSISARKAYVEHVTNVLSLLGMKSKDAVAEAQRILDLEIRLGRRQLSDSALRDIYAVNNPTKIDDLKKLAPTIAWPEYFAVFSMATPPSTVNLQIPAFVAAVDSALNSVPVSTWKAYLKLRLVDQMQEALPSAFGTEYVTFTNKTNHTVRTGGTRNCLKSVLTLLPDASWQLYVASFDTSTFRPDTSRKTHDDTLAAFKAVTLDTVINFNDSTRIHTELTKREIIRLVDNIKTAMKTRLMNLPWMADDVKKQSVIKIDSITTRFEYPDYRSVSYKGLTLNPGSYADNMYQILRYNRQRDLEQIGRSSNTAPWGMPFTIVNAYYTPVRNQIVFPVGILVAPFFDPGADEASNYGAIGVIVGHEITHALTSPARQYSQKIVDQFSSYTVADSMHVNGWQTLDENLADLGGILLSYDALQIALKDKPRTPIDGFTPEQRFFISFANVWRRKPRPDDEKRLVRRDPHAPAEWRVYGTLLNTEAFAKAFGCKPGDRMVQPDGKVVPVW